MLNQAFRRAVLNLWTALTLIAPASACLAQNAAPSPTSPGADAVAATAEEIGDLLPNRSDADIRGDQDAAARVRASAETEITQARERSIGLKSRIEVKKKEIELIETRMDAADKANLEAEKRDLEAQKKSEENRLRILERLQDVSSARAGKAEAAVEAAKADMEFCKRERDLAAKRSEWDAFAAAPPTGEDAVKKSGELRKSVQEAEKRVLEGMKDRANKHAEAAKRAAEHADKAAQALDAWNEANAL